MCSLFHAPGVRTRRGFSLVEILVTVAAIAILAAILFPMLARMRAAGYQTKCASNMQQLAAAFQTYSQDWVDYWPCPGGKPGDWTYWAQTGQGGLEGYVKQRGNKSVWCCPRMPDWKSYYPPRTYTMNSYLREPADYEHSTDPYAFDCTDIIKGIRMTNIPKMSSTILLFEGLPLTIGWETKGEFIYCWRCCNWTWAKGYYSKTAYTIDPTHPWHGNFNNYLYCDGHIQARPPGRRTVGELSTYKEMYQWYVDKAGFQTKKWPAYKRAGAAVE